MSLDDQGLGTMSSSLASGDFSSGFASDTAKQPISAEQTAVSNAAKGIGSGLAQQHHNEFGALFGHGAAPAPVAATVVGAPAPAAPAAPMPLAPPPMIQAPQMQAMSDRRTKTQIAPADRSLADFLAALGGHR